MTVLITGGAGFVGAYAVKRFAADGEHVVSFDASPRTDILDLALTKKQRERVTLESGDLLDLPHLLRVARKHKVERIVHLAYMITLPTRANPGLAQRVNIEGTNNVFELALTIGANRLVWVSTIDVFGPKSVSANGVVANDAPYDPQGIYGGCKLLNELAARDYASAFGLDPVCLRIPAAFGPGVTQSWVRFVPQLIKDLVEGNPASAPALTKVMPWLYVEDIAEALSRAFGAPRAPELGYTLPGHNMGVDEIVAMIRDMFPGVPVTPIDWPDFGTVPSYDGTAAEKLLGWKPRHSVADGLRRIADYYGGARSGAVPE